MNNDDSLQEKDNIQELFHQLALKLRAHNPDIPAEEVYNFLTEIVQKLPQKRKDESNI